MKRKILGLTVFMAVVALTLVMTAPVLATNTLFVDDGYTSATTGWGTTAFAHPQDAVNAAAPGDTILVYPGTYSERVYTSPKPPHWGPGDQYAPALIVWKDGLIIQAVDPDPASTVIQTTYNFWVNAYQSGGGGGGSIERSTGGVWDPVAMVFNGPCVRPKFGTAPNACAVIASDVTLDGLTFRCPGMVWNTAGVMIGGLYAGYGGATETLGFNNNTIKNCVFKDSWHGIYLWHSSGNTIIDNTVEALGNSGHWAGISIYDGYNDAQIGLGNLSTGNLICGNSLADKGIAVGAWAPTNWTDLNGTTVCGNICTEVGVSYAHGPVTIACNTFDGAPAGFWYYLADMVTRVNGVSYAGDLVVPVGTSASLAAQLSYDGTPDAGSGVVVTFDVVGEGKSYQFTATTVAGGLAEVSGAVPLGVYDVTATAGVCDCCELADSAKLVVYDPSGGFVTGGGWIMSPAGAYAADLTLEGKATFGFVSKYQKGANVPTGNTEFQFKAGDLNFKSTSYDWLVVAGNKAKYKGVGTINGTGSYQFMLSAIDGQYNKGTDPDQFRIKIWDDTGVIYDNRTDLGDLDYGGTILGGGSIVIHK